MADYSNRVKWKAVVAHAATIVESYETGVTLRQLFYRLVSAQLIPNNQNAYKMLSKLTAQARREGRFPDLIDNTRGIRRPSSWYGSAGAMKSWIDQFRIDRTEGQEYSIYVGVEKNALATLIASWYRDRGIPVLAFGGYPSQTFVNQIMSDIERQDRPAILYYGGDFDATGVDILRDFEKRTEGYFEQVHRVALNPDQIEEHDLPELPGKSWDARAAGFEAVHGKLVQVELDALPPDVLKDIYDAAVYETWNEEVYEEVLEEEASEKKRLVMPSEVGNMIEELRFIRDINQPDELIKSDMLDQLLKKYDDVF